MGKFYFIDEQIYTNVGNIEQSFIQKTNNIYKALDLYSTRKKMLLATYDKDIKNVEEYMDLNNEIENSELRVFLYNGEIIELRICCCEI